MKAKVSDFNSIRVIKNYFEQFRNQFPNHSEPIRKTFKILSDSNQLKINLTHSGLFRDFNRNKSESTQDWIYSDSFGLNQLSN